MAALDFPSSPSTNQTYTANGNTWRWDGTTWASANPITVANGCIFETEKTISSSYTITSSRNAFSVGPITISSGATVTIPSGSRWIIF